MSQSVKQALKKPNSQWRSNGLWIAGAAGVGTVTASVITFAGVAIAHHPKEADALLSPAAREITASTTASATAAGAATGDWNSVHRTPYPFHRA